MKRFMKLRTILLMTLVLVMTLTALPLTASAKTTTNSKNNLLKNGSFEKWTEDGYYKKPKNWKEKKSSDGLCWGSVENENIDVDSESYTGGKDIYDGKYVVWPVRRGVEKTYLYQDVTLKKSQIGKTLELSGLLCNYNQYPNDEAILRIEILDKNGKILTAKQASQRNPKWVRQSVQIVVPKNAAKARVKLIANRYVGYDNDAYFDDIRLKVVNKTVAKKPFTITGNKSKAKPGATDKLKIKGGRSTKASAYNWRSSYELYATVNAKGVVTFTDSYNAKEGVTIYATDKKTGLISSFTYKK